MDVTYINVWTGKRKIASIRFSMTNEFSDWLLDILMSLSLLRHFLLVSVLICNCLYILSLSLWYSGS